MDSNNKSVLNSQKKVIIVLGVIVVLLLAAFIIFPMVFKGKTYSVTLPKYDEITGDKMEYDMIKSADGTKVTLTENETHLIAEASGEITYTARPFIYPEIEVDDIKEAVITNSHGEYALYLDGAAGEHLIRGNEYQPYNEQQLSNLRFQARFMLANSRLEETYNTDEELAAFGLDSASNPVKVTVSDTSGNTYNVYIGNALVSGNGYYAKDDDPYVYILDSSVSVFFEDKYAFINPMLTVPMSKNQYQYVDEFTVLKNGEPFISSEIVPEEQRANTGNVNLHKITYPGNYPASFNNYYMALECFGNLTGDKVIETGVLASGEENAEALFEKYGLTVATNDVTAKFGGVEYRFLTGTRFTDENGVAKYYAYSPVFDMIVTLPVSNAPFLDYQLLDFINSAFFQMNITNVAEISFTTPAGFYNFLLEGTGDALKVTETTTGRSVDAGSFRQIYFSLLTAKIEGYAGAENVTGGKELSFKVKTVYGETTTYDFSLISTTRELLTLDGSSQFYTARSYVTDIADKLQRLMNGEIIAPEY